MNFSQEISANPDVVSQEIEGESVLLQLEGGRYFGLDVTGTRKEFADKDLLVLQVSGQGE